MTISLFGGDKSCFRPNWRPPEADSNRPEPYLIDYLALLDDSKQNPPFDEVEIVLGAPNEFQVEFHTAPFIQF